MVDTTWNMAARDKKKFIETVLMWAQEKFGGSRDPEIEDAVDVVDFFDTMFGQQPDVFEKLLKDVCARILSLDTSFVREAGLQTVPDPPEEGTTMRCKLAPWMLGFSKRSSVKGKSKMHQIYKCLVEFLEKPYSSAKDPLDILMPHGLSIASTLPPFSVRHSVGFAKSLTCRLILFAVVDMRWADTVCRMFLKELQALTIIDCVYSPAAEPKGQMIKSLADKMTAADRTRPDVIQIFHTMQDRALVDGVELTPNITTYLDEFQTQSLSESRRFTPLEYDAVQVMPLLPEEGQNKLEYHYQTFDVESSAWPLQKLASPAMREGTKPTRGSANDILAPDALQLWNAVLSPTPRKREANLVRRIGIFIFKLKEAQRTKKNKTLNIKFLAQNFRCKLSDEMAYEVAALFTHWAPEWKGMMSQENWDKCVLKFKRGGLDAQLQEKCGSKIMHTARDFRFLQAYGGVEVQITSAASLDAQQEVAKKNLERANLEVVLGLIKKEENNWTTFCAAMQAWKCMSQAQRSEFKEKEKTKNEGLITNEMNLKYPCKALASADHIHTYVNACLDAWLLPTTCSREDAWVVWFLNFTIPGYVFQSDALTAIVKVADAISMCPERVCAIILAPNTGCYGDSYNDRQISEALEEVRGLLVDPDLSIDFRPITFSFDESTIPPQSQRPGQHEGFMLISNKTVDEPDGTSKSISRFALSKLWVRRGVTQVPLQKMKDNVNPLADNVRGDLNPATDMSKSQRRKQWFAGWRFVSFIRSKLWQGVPITNQDYAAWVEMYAYDFSVGQCIQRSAFTSESQRTKQPQEMVCSLMWARMDTPVHDHWSLLVNFHERACKRSLRQLLREKLYFLEGWEEKEFKNQTESPSYKVTDYKATYPAANGQLPIRHEWLMLTTGKFETEEVLAEFNAAIEEHDKKFNPSRTPYTGETLKRKADTAAEKPNADEIPHQEGDPDTREAFLQANKGAVSVETLGQEFFFTTTGQLWCLGKVDDVIDTKLPVALVHGEFKLNDLARERLTAGKSWKIEFKSGDDLVQCSSDVSPNECPKELTPLREILAALGNPNLACHTAVPKFTKNDAGEVIAQEYDIKCDTDCSFTPLRVMKEFKEEWENAGSRLFLGPAFKEWDIKTQEHNGGKLIIRTRLHHKDSNQTEGVNPVKPGVFPQVPVKVVANTLRRWA